MREVDDVAVVGEGQGEGQSVGAAVAALRRSSFVKLLHIGQKLDETWSPPSS